MSDVPPGPPLLWGAWRANANDRFYTAWCPVCGGDLWLHRNGFDDWRASCENGCPRAEMDAAADVLLAAQRQRYQDEREARGAMDPDDPFNSIEADVYIRQLYPEIEHRRGFYTCPFHGGGDERTPSLHATGVLWHCHACKLGGSVYDFAAAKWGITPRGEGFKEIRLLLADAFRKVPT